ncbi:hypothetical protein HGRIS_001661 [Hohenbuehelia grisea]|uniref:Uncharacterized protein n=1 Tax=Hohenbuehelia grisea TaxID=104357 RepID=A0ABR3JI53_9AGAR
MDHQRLGWTSELAPYTGPDTKIQGSLKQPNSFGRSFGEDQERQVSISVWADYNSLLYSDEHRHKLVHLEELFFNALMCDHFQDQNSIQILDRVQPTEAHYQFAHLQVHKILCGLVQNQKRWEAIEETPAMDDPFHFITATIDTIHECGITLKLALTLAAHTQQLLNSESPAVPAQECTHALLVLSTSLRGLNWCFDAALLLVWAVEISSALLDGHPCAVHQRVLGLSLTLRSNVYAMLAAPGAISDNEVAVGLWKDLYYRFGETRDLLYMIDAISRYELKLFRQGDVEQSLDLSRQCLILLRTLPGDFGQASQVVTWCASGEARVVFSPCRHFSKPDWWAMIEAPCLWSLAKNLAFMGRYREALVAARDAISCFEALRSTLPCLRDFDGTAPLKAESASWAPIQESLGMALEVRPSIFIHEATSRRTFGTSIQAEGATQCNGLPYSAISASNSMPSAFSLMRKAHIFLVAVEDLRRCMGHAEQLFFELVLANDSDDLRCTFRPLDTVQNEAGYSFLHRQVQRAMIVVHKLPAFWARRRKCPSAESSKGLNPNQLDRTYSHSPFRTALTEIIHMLHINILNDNHSSMHQSLARLYLIARCLITLQRWGDADSLLGWLSKIASSLICSDRRPTYRRFLGRVLDRSSISSTLQGLSVATSLNKRAATVWNTLFQSFGNIEDLPYLVESLRAYDVKLFAQGRFSESLDLSRQALLLVRIFVDLNPSTSSTITWTASGEADVVFSSKRQYSSPLNYAHVEATCLWNTAKGLAFFGRYTEAHIAAMDAISCYEALTTTCSQYAAATDLARFKLESSSWISIKRTIGMPAVYYCTSSFTENSDDSIEVHSEDDYVERRGGRSGLQLHIDDI